MAKAAWLAGEAAILATALAELVGGAIALRLLFGLPLLGGVAVTGVGTFAVLALTRGNADRHERVIAVLLAIVAASFVFLLFKANPAWTEVAQGVARTGGAARSAGLPDRAGHPGRDADAAQPLLAFGLAGERARSLPADARDIAMRVTRNDTALSLGVAMLINAAIMIVAAASLSGPGLIVSSLDDAHAAIGHTLGAGAAIIFAVALYAAGQSSTITGVLAGRILSRGFQAGRNWSDRRRALVTRLIAGAAAAGLLGYSGGQDPDGLLVLSQVILSLALPFALAPLVLLACRKSIMGRHAARRLGLGGHRGHRRHHRAGWLSAGQYLAVTRHPRSTTPWQTKDASIALASFHLPCGRRPDRQKSPDGVGVRHPCHAASRPRRRRRPPCAASVAARPGVRRARPTRLAPGWPLRSGSVPARRTCVHASTWHRS